MLTCAYLGFCLQVFTAGVGPLRRANPKNGCHNFRLIFTSSKLASNYFLFFFSPMSSLMAFLLEFLSANQLLLKQSTRVLNYITHFCTPFIYCLFIEQYVHILSVERLIGLVGRVFANGLGDRGSIPGQIILKTLKMVLDTSLLNTQHNKVWIKGKVEQSRERSSTLPDTLV